MPVIVARGTRIAVGSPISRISLRAAAMTMTTCARLVTDVGVRLLVVRDFIVM
jgi:hypothetical protein